MGGLMDARYPDPIRRARIIAALAAATVIVGTAFVAHWLI